MDPTTLVFFGKLSSLAVLVLCGTGVIYYGLKSFLEWQNCGKIHEADLRSLILAFLGTSMALLVLKIYSLGIAS